MNIFSNDSLFGRFFGELGNILLLNALFLICSIPIITIGISYTSMEYAFLKHKRKPDASIFRAFFHSFRQNFKQATLSWMLCLLLFFILRVDFHVFGPNGVYPFLPFYYLLFFPAIVIFFTAWYLFPVIAVFHNTLKNLILQSFFLAVKHIPFTIVMCLCFLCFMYLTFSNVTYFPFFLSLWLFFGFGLLGYSNANFFFHIFLPYLENEDDVC